MPSHFSSIGLPIQSNDELHELVEQIGKDSERVSADSGSYLRWSSGIGPEIWLQMNRRDECVGITPYFEAKSAFRVSAIADVSRPDDTPLEGAVHCWANPTEGQAESGEYPFVFDVIDRDCCRKLDYPFQSEAKLSAFAHELTVYESEDAYDAQDAGQPRFAPESFIPSGLFTPDGQATRPPASEAIFTGRVLEASLLTNPLSQKPFHWINVKTLGGIVDVVCDPELINAAVVKGGIVSGSFWLCGRILGPKRRNVLKGWFGKKARV